MRDRTRKGTSDDNSLSAKARVDQSEKGTGAISRALKALGGFFYRLFYVVLLVWETKPLILFAMVF
ncbi:MAG: hypothetical protein J6128_04345, partial [Clostridia bacterium]|nr:hypothetical protein [Clostridia bacterium]